MQVVYVFLFPIITIWAVKVDDYCKHGALNTPCKYKCVRDKRCGDRHPAFRAFTNEERLAAVRKHNQIRNDVAAGKYVNQNLPAAKNMNMLAYDMECEFMTACYLKQCLGMEHDKRRIALDGTYCGQNLAQRMAPYELKISISLMEYFIQAWFNEIELLTPENSKHFFTSFKKLSGAGHLTALIWSDVKYVGCAHMLYDRNGLNVYNLFCNYKPGGNIRGRVVYNIKESNCTRSNIYPNLCGKHVNDEMKELILRDDDTFEFPVDVVLNTEIRPSPSRLFFLLLLFLILSSRIN